MRVLALMLMLAACHAEKAASPAWPAASTADDDGGESIAPRAETVATAVESSEDDNVAEPVAADETPAAAPTPAAETPAAAAPADPQPTGEVIQADEITIEIEDD